MPSGFQYAARDRYRFATVQGDGPHAVVSRCVIAKYVRLYRDPLQADAVAKRPCGSLSCRMDHTREDLTPVIVPSAQVPGQFADWKD
jgi:hypothetical protein